MRRLCWCMLLLFIGSIQVAGVPSISGDEPVCSHLILIPRHDQAVVPLLRQLDISVNFKLDDHFVAEARPCPSLTMTGERRKVRGVSCPAAARHW